MRPKGPRQGTSVASDASVAPTTLGLDGRLALRVAEAAAALGVSERHLRQILPELPHVHLGASVRIPVADLREWLSKRAKTEAESTRSEAEAIVRSLKDPA